MTKEVYANIFEFVLNLQIVYFYKLHTLCIIIFLLWVCIVTKHAIKYT